eukprot:TRINITY_DN28866_c0_g1_i1.p1 TRINITY_DN28866_c0_g1~~TRINITY_DN28866_c0_g1_i1.p1  ORF type:complete len:374 (+),score=108.46 TRINITY_DN28866_c0_g1_i1:68-1123(+)
MALAQHVLLFWILFCASSVEASTLGDDETALMSLKPSHTTKIEAASKSSKADHEFPDFGKLGKDLMKAVPAAKNLADKGSELALKLFKDGGAKVNATLDIVGKKIQTLNTTTFKYIEEMQDKVRKANASANGKAEVFATALKSLLQQVTKQSDQLADQMKKVKSMASQGLEAMGQKDAASKMDAELEKLFETTDSWTSTIDDTLKSLSAVKMPALGLLDEAHGEDPTALAASLAKNLQQPLAQLDQASQKLQGVSSQAFDAFGTMVEAGIAAANASHLPEGLVTKATELLKGVQTKAKEELEPLGSIATNMTDGIYKAADEADISVQHSGAATLGTATTILSLTVLALWQF